MKSTIKTNPLNLEETSTVTINQHQENSNLLNQDRLDSSRDQICAGEWDDVEKKEEQEGKEEQPGMSEVQDNSELGIMLIATHAWHSNSPRQMVYQEDQDFTIQNTEEFDMVDADYINIALWKLEGATDHNLHAQMEDLIEHVDADCWVTVLVRVVALRAIELLSELSRYPSCCQSCCQSCRQSAAAVRAAVRVAVRAEPLSELLSKRMWKLNPQSE